MTGELMFDSKDELARYFGALPAISVKRVGVCRCCGKFHAETVMRGPSGGSSGTTRECNPIRPEVEAHNRHMSERQTERWKAL